MIQHLVSVLSKYSKLAWYFWSGISNDWDMKPEPIYVAAANFEPWKDDVPWLSDPALQNSTSKWRARAMNQRGSHMHAMCPTPKLRLKPLLRLHSFITKVNVTWRSGIVMGRAFCEWIQCLGQGKKNLPSIWHVALHSWNPWYRDWSMYLWCT